MSSMNIIVIAIIFFTIANFENAFGYKLEEKNIDDSMDTLDRHWENLKLLIRSKRAPEPQLSLDNNYIDGRASNVQYRPLLRYKNIKSKKKRLFVPNLFG